MGAKVKKILNVFQSIEVVIAVIILILMLLPKLLGISTAAVQTGSMEPNVHVGALVYYKEVDTDEIEKDDIIAFEYGNMLIMHRVYEVRDEYFITKGDANDVVDSKYVYFDEVKGKVLFNIPYIGNIAYGIQGNKLIYILIGIIILNIIISIVISIINKKERAD